MSLAVLLPVCGNNNPDHFDSALVSVATQKNLFEPLHIYVGTDGPLSPHLESVLVKHSTHIHQCIRNRGCIGPTATLNRLVAAVNDERLLFRMDADDISQPERMAQQVAFMDAHPEIAIAGSAIEEFDEGTSTRYLRTYPSDPAVIRRSICAASPVAHPAACIRPEVFRALGGYPDVRGQDIALWFEALRRGYQISNLSEPLLRHRVSDQFYKRRSWLGRAWPEFRIYMRGIWMLHGITWRYVFPITRFILRLSGPRLSRRIYATGVRNRIAGANTRF